MQQSSPHRKSQHFPLWHTLPAAQQAVPPQLVCPGGHVTHVPSGEHTAPGGQHDSPQQVDPGAQQLGRVEPQPSGFSAGQHTPLLQTSPDAQQTCPQQVYPRSQLPTSGQMTSAHPPTVGR
jgi:hypothetical protein